MTTAAELRAKILASSKPAPVPVQTKTWGTVYVRLMTVAEIDVQNADPEEKNRIARSVCRVLCDESGALLFDPGNPVDVQLVAELPWSEVSKIADKATELAGAGEGNG